MQSKPNRDLQHGQTSRRLVPVLIVCMVLVSVSVPAAAQVKPTKSVLVFTEYGLSYPAVAAVMAEIRSSLEKDPSYHIDVYSESLETALFPDKGSQQEFRAWFARKYRNHRPDVMIAAGPEPLVFLASYHSVFFPDVPVVFCCTTQLQAHFPKLDSNFTGAWLRVEPGKTLDVALRLLPSTQRVVVVGGVAPFDRGLEAVTKNALQNHDSKLEISYLTELDMRSLLDRLSRLPKNTIVIYTAIGTDAAGHQFIAAKESAPMVVAASDVPVFGMAEVLMGTGIVGGYVVSYSAQGQTAAQMVRRILAGEKPQSIPVVDGPNLYMFDWRALRRWKLKESNLPQASVVLFRTPTVWEGYPREIVATGLALLALLALSAYLLFERRRRRSAEVLVHANFIFEKLISELSTYFIDLNPETIDAGIQQVLDKLLSFFKADRISVLEFSADGTQLLRTYNSAGPQNAPAKYRFTLEECPWYTAKILNREKIVVTDLENIASLSESEKRYFASNKISSIASIPLEGGHTVLGALALITVGRRVEWPQLLVDQLTIAGQVFANALVKKRADDALVSSELLKGAILSALSSSITVLDETGEIILTNSHWRGPADPLAGDDGLIAGSNYLEICRQAAERGDLAARQALMGMDAILRGEQQRFEFEWPCARSGTLRWSLMGVTPLRNSEKGLVVNYVDITARKQAEQECQELSGRLIRAQEDERSRLARELHDDFNQRLAVLAIDLERTESFISESPIEAIRRMRELWNRVSEIGADLHSLSHRLHSSTLESLGLVSGVSAYCGDFTEQHDIQVDFMHKEIPRYIPPEVALCIFRLVQEGLRNVKKHSGAIRAEVFLEGVADKLHLSLVDEGIGFDTTKSSAKAGLGIQSMQERLRILGGRVQIQSQPGDGTKIDAWVPLNPVTTGSQVSQYSNA